MTKAKHKPIGWWYYKIMCEIGWKFRNTFEFGWDMYYKNLNKMCDTYNINLYGDILNPERKKRI